MMDRFIGEQAVAKIRCVFRVDFAESYVKSAMMTDSGDPG